MLPEKNVEIITTAGGVTKRLATIDPGNPMTTAPSIPETDLIKLRALEAEARRLLVAKTGDPIHYVIGKIDYQLLDADDRERIIRQHNEYTKPRSLVQKFGVSPYKSFETALETQSKAFGVIPIDLSEKISAGTITAEDIRVASMSFTHDMTEISINPQKAHANFFRPGSARFSLEYLTQQAENINSIRTQAENFLDSYVVFDIETPGLQKEKGIFEYAARFFERQTGEAIAQETPEQSIFFRTSNPYMRSGAVAYEGQVMTPAEFMDEVYRGQGVEIADEATGIKNILTQLERSGWTIVGQNIEFDIERLYSAAAALPETQSDQELKRLFLAFTDALADNKVRRLDTLLFSKAIFGDKIEIATELMARSTFTKHSIENILAQTDFLEYALQKQIFSRETLTEMFVDSPVGGHVAKTDTNLTAALLRYQIDIIQGQYTPKMRAQGQLSQEALAQLSDEARFIEDKIRPHIFGSPIAPRIPLETKFIHPLIAEHPELGPKLAPGTGRPATLSLNPEQQAAILSRMAYSGEQARIPTQTTDPIQTARVFREVMATLYDDRGASVSGDLASLARNQDMLAYQQRLMQANVPFSRLHFAEREATASFQYLAEGSAQLFEQLMQQSGESDSVLDIIRRQQLASQFGDVFPDVFMEMSEARVFKSGVTSLPLEFVEEALAGTDRVGAGGVRYLETSLLPDQYKRIAFNVGGLTDEDIKLLREQLQNTELTDRFAIDRKTAQDIYEALDPSRRKINAVQVASISGEQFDSRVSAEAWDLFADIQRQMRGEITDVSAGNKSPFIALLAPSDLREQIEFTTADPTKPIRKFMGVGPLVSSVVAESPTLLEQEMQMLVESFDELPESRQALFDLYRLQRGNLSFPEWVRQFNERNVGTRQSRREGIERAVREAGDDTEEVINILSGRRSTQSITEEALRRNALLKRYGKAAGISSAIALSGYFIYKKVKENSKINETVNTQEYEENVYNSFRPDAPEYDTGNPIIPVTNPIAQNRESRRLEYMQTAGVNRRLWDRRIGHTNMGNDRYNHLYGG